VGGEAEGGALEGARLAGGHASGPEERPLLFWAVVIMIVTVVVTCRGRRGGKGTGMRQGKGGSLDGDKTRRFGPEHAPLPISLILF
jgi:hypothetical protein